MDCPHCGTENLIGTKRCVSCGKGMHEAPAFAPPPAAPAAGTASPEPVQSLCRMCQQPFDDDGRGASDGAPVCPSCRAIAARTGTDDDVAGSLASADAPEPGDASRTRGASARARPVVVRRRRSFAGPVAAVVGLALVLGSVAFVVARREPDHGAALVASAKAGTATVDVACGAGFGGTLRTEVRLVATRDEVRTNAGLVAKVLDLRQTSEQEADVAFVRAEGREAHLDVTSRGRVVSQQGRIDLEDAGTTSVHPWGGDHLRVRVRTGPGTAPVQLDGEPVLPGRDVPPFLHLGSLGATAADFSPGTKWRTRLRIPALCDGRGALVATEVPAEVSYAGTVVRGAAKCAAFRISGESAPAVPRDLAAKFPKATGRISGAVWVELATGVVHGADVEVESRLWRETGRVEDDLRVTVRILADRR